MTENEILNSRYQLISPIGRGSFGEVWMANDLQLDITVAVKVYAALDGKGITEFKDEFKNVYKLHHPNLLRPDYFDTVGDNPYLVMPYCPKSADDLAGGITEHELWRFIRDVASGLAYLHDNDVIHRDIKPENILQDERGNYVISDFGLSTKMRSTLRQASMRQNDGFSGTIAYMAPELFTSKPTAVKATDVWALGVTIYEMATGELPFCGQGGCMLNAGAESPELDNTKWSSNLNEVMRLCLAKETWDRPTAKDLAEYSNLVMNGDKRTWSQWKSGDASSYISKPRLFRRIVILTTILVLFSVGAYLFMTYSSQAKIKQEYSILKSSCEDDIIAGSAENYRPLLKARLSVDSLAVYEHQYDYLHKSSDSLNSILLTKIDIAQKAWARSAKSQSEIAEDFGSAISYYHIASRLKESSEIREALTNISQQSGCLGAYMIVSGWKVDNVKLIIYYNGINNFVGKITLKYELSSKVSSEIERGQVETMINAGDAQVLEISIDHERNGDGIAVPSPYDHLKLSNNNITFYNQDK